MPDKNGEVWAGVLNGRQTVRLDPRSERWTVYQLPEPYAYDRRTWIDNSTNPVTVWYVDYNGVLVRVEPLDCRDHASDDPTLADLNKFELRFGANLRLPRNGIRPHSSVSCTDDS